MKTKITSIVLILVLGVGSAIAQKPARFERGNRQAMTQDFRQGRGERGRDFLLLTAEQIEAFKPTILESAKELKPLKDELRELNARHQTLTTAVKPDLNAINKSIEKIGTVKVEIAKVQAKQQQEFRALLTEEQLFKLDNRKERMKDSPLNLRHQGKRRM